MIFTRPPFRAAFTLVELMISVTLMSVILGASYLCLSAGLNSQRLIDARAESVQSGRTAVNLIAADLRSATPMISSNGLPVLVGAVHPEEGWGNLDFATRNYEPRRKGESDYCVVSYFLAPDPESDAYILKRRRKTAFDQNPLAGGRTEEIVRGVRDLQFTYYDYWNDSYEDWGDLEGKTIGMTLPPENAAGLPYSVRVTIVVDAGKAKRRATNPKQEEAAEVEAPDAMTFETVAHLRLADAVYRQMSASSANNSSAAPAQGPPANEE